MSEVKTLELVSFSRTDYDMVGVEVGGGGSGVRGKGWEGRVKELSGSCHHQTELHAVVTPS